MAKKQSKVKPFMSRIDPTQMTRKDLQAIMKNNSINNYAYTDLDVVTPFGVIKMRECEITDLEYGDNMPLVYDTDSINEALDGKDWIESVVLLEKAIEKHPKAVIFYFQLMESYDKLKEYGKSEYIADECYSLNKGLPLVDIKAMSFQSEEDTVEYNFFYNEKLHNIHDAYPKRAHFHPIEISEYYCLLGECALNHQNIPLAEQCSEITQDVDPKSQKGYLLKMLIRNRKNPGKAKLKLVFGLILILSVIGLIIWGIYRLFAWIL